MEVNRGEEVSKDKGQKKEALYRHTGVNEYEDPAHIFALDYYRPGSQGDDDFSRKEAWFYYLGGIDLEEEFASRVDELMQDLFVDNTVEWDYFTLAPGHEMDELNDNMKGLSDRIAEEGNVKYRQVLRRSKSVEESRELGSIRKRIIAQENSIEVTEDVKGKNIIILDNVSISGVYLAYLTQMLMDAGARKVSCVTLGVTNHERGVTRLKKGETASGAMKEEGEEK